MAGWGLAHLSVSPVHCPAIGWGQICKPVTQPVSQGGEAIVAPDSWLRTTALLLRLNIPHCQLWLQNAPSRLNMDTREWNWARPGWHSYSHTDTFYRQTLRYFACTYFFFFNQGMFFRAQFIQSHLYHILGRDKPCISPVQMPARLGEEVDVGRCGWPSILLNQLKIHHHKEIWLKL